MSRLLVWVDDTTMERLKKISLQLRRPVWDLAEAAISEAVLKEDPEQCGYRSASIALPEASREAMAPSGETVSFSPDSGRK